MRSGLLRNNRLKALCAAFALLVCLPSAAALADFGIVNNPNPADRLNLRTQTTIASATQGKYYNGVQVAIDQYFGNGWVQVHIGNAAGFMQAEFLAINAPPGSVASAIPTAYVINQKPGDKLNLRENPNTSAAILGRYENGTPVQVWGVANSWWHVTVDGKIGYMQANFLSLSGYNPTPAPAPQPQPGPVSSYAVVNNPNPSDRLNLRVSVGPNGQKGNSIAKYYSGVQVEIRSYPNVPGWAFVRIGSMYGYMQTDYLAFGAAASYVRSAIPKKTVYNQKTAARLNLRETPSDKARSLGRYYNGTVVEVLGVTIDGAWYHVRVDGLTGFMMSKFLK